MSNNLQWNVDLNLNSTPARQQFDRYMAQAQQGNEEAMDKINQRLGGKKEIKTVMEFDADFGDLVAKTKTVRTEYDKIATAVRKRAEVEKGSVTSLTGQLRQATQVRNQYARLAKDGKTVNANWKTANNEVKRLNIELAKAKGNWLQMAKAKMGGGVGNILSMANAFSQIGFAVTGAVQGIQAVVGAVQPLVNRQKQVEGLSLALQGFGMNAQQAGQIMNNAKVQALTYGASLTQLERGYKRVAPAVMNAGGSMRDVSDVMASISARTTTLGLNSEQTGRYIEAFAQVMGKGKLQGEELNQQFSELDGALRGQIAAYLDANHGITDLAGAMQRGEVTADLFLEAFNAISEDMRNNLAGAIDEVQTRLDELNVAQVTNIVNTLNTVSLDSLRESLGPIGDSFKRIWVAMTQFFAAVTTNLPGIKSFMMNFFKGIGIALDVVIRGFMAGLQVALKAIDVILGALGGAIEWAMKNIPGLKQLYEGAAAGMNALGDSFNEGYDAIMQLGPGVIETGDALSDLDGRILALKNKLKDGNVEEYRKGIERLQQQAAEAINLQELQKLVDKIKEIKQELKFAKEEQSAAQSVFQQEKQDLDALRNGVKTYFGELYAQNDQAKEKVNERYDREREQIRSMREATKARHEAEMADLQAQNQARQNALQSEIDALGARTPAEQALQQLRREEIQSKLQSSGLSKRERLELTAQLERMNAQKLIEEKQLQLKKEKENAAKKEAALAERQKAEMQLLKEEEKELGRQKKADIKQLKEDKDELKKQEKEILSLMKDQDKEMDLQGKSLGQIVNLVTKQKQSYDQAKTAVENTTEAVVRLESQLKTATGQAVALKNAIDQANAAKNNGGGGNSSGNSNGGVQTTYRAAGGPVLGGSDYTVNELGTEGFISRSGKMSEIKAPAWGSWKAPGSGSVIPAHIWAQIKAQQALGGAQTASPGMSGTGSLISALRGLETGGSRDTINNTITITSDNPQQALQETLLETRRDKRRRYH